MKELYISDLDGTLLQPNVELSIETIQKLNRLIDNGLHFSIATARTAASVTQILKPLNLSIPIILMNGVAIYDLNNNEYLKVHPLPVSQYDTIASILEHHKLSPYIYEIKSNKLSTYYTSVKNSAMKEFMDERISKYNKPFTKISNIKSAKSEHAIYFAVLDTKENLDAAYEEIKKLDDISIAYYRDIYFDDDIYFLEVFSNKATKYNGLKYLEETYHYDKITSFGDNLNDLPMFEASTISCAVSNGKDLVKERATYIIESNIDNGVANYIEKNFDN